jgi:hypothetical protein
MSELMFSSGSQQNPYGPSNPYGQPASPNMPPYTPPQNPYGQQQDPYGQQQSPYGPPQRRQGGGCGRCFGCGCLTLLLLLVVVGVGGFIAYRNGNLDVATLLKAVGQAQPRVQVDNLRDDAVFVAITQLNQERGSTAATYGGQVRSLDIVSYSLLQAGRYRVDFGTRTGRKDLGSCTIDIASGAAYQFVPLPDKIIVNNLDDAVSDGRDLVIETSSLCE